MGMKSGLRTRRPREFPLEHTDISSCDMDDAVHHGGAAANETAGPLCLSPRRCGVLDRVTPPRIRAASFQKRLGATNSALTFGARQSRFCPVQYTFWLQFSAP